MQTFLPLPQLRKKKLGESPNFFFLILLGRGLTLVRHAYGIVEFQLALETAIKNHCILYVTHDW